MDQWSKTTSHKKRCSETVQHGELRSDRGSWIINECFLKLALFNINDTFKAGNWSSYVFLKLVYLTNHDIFNCVKRQCGPTKNPRPNKNENHGTERGDLCHSDISEWLQEFRENLVDDRVPEHSDSHASSSHELSLEPKPARSADLGKHSVYTHFPKDRNCEICQKPKISRARAEDALAEPYLVQKI